MKLFHRILCSSTLLVLSPILVLGGCGLKTNPSDLRITNGKDIKESLYPSVVRIRAFGAGGLGGCTGTFVTHYQVVTAAHCLEGLDPVTGSIIAAKFDKDGKELVSFGADSFKVHPLYDPKVKASPYDLAVVNFPRHAASEISLIASQRPALNVWVQLVGYGYNENFFDEAGQQTGSGDGQKRVGTNKLLAYEYDMLRIDGVPGATAGVNPGLQSCSGQGDSGGPLFYNSATLIGTNYGGVLLKETAEDGTVSYACVSLYVDLNKEENVTFLESVLNHK